MSCLKIGFPGTDPPLVYGRRVRILAADRWLITCRGEGAGHSEEVMDHREPLQTAELQALISTGPGTRYQTGHDIAIVLLRGFVSTYPPAVQAIRRRAEQAQLDFIRQTRGGSTLESVDRFREELILLTWPIQELTEQLTAITRPGQPPKMAWFPTVLEEPALQTRDLIESSLVRLDRLSDRITALSHSVSSAETTAVLELSAAEEARTERLQRSIALISAIFIAPALIASFFDAVPEAFQGDAWARTALVVGAMILAGELAWYVARRWFVLERTMSVLPTRGEHNVSDQGALRDIPKRPAVETCRDFRLVRFRFKHDRNVFSVEAAPVLGELAREVLPDPEVRAYETIRKALLRVLSTLTEPHAVIALRHERIQSPGRPMVQGRRLCAFWAACP